MVTIKEKLHPEGGGDQYKRLRNCQILKGGRLASKVRSHDDGDWSAICGTTEEIKSKLALLYRGKHVI